MLVVEISCSVEFSALPLLLLVVKFRFDVVEPRWTVKWQKMIVTGERTMNVFLNPKATCGWIERGICRTREKNHAEADVISKWASVTSPVLLASGCFMVRYCSQLIGTKWVRYDVSHRKFVSNIVTGLMHTILSFSSRQTLMSLQQWTLIEQSHPRLNQTRLYMRAEY